VNNAGIRQWMRLEEGRQELTFGYSDGMMKSGPEELKKIFDRMNQPNR